MLVKTMPKFVFKQSIAIKHKYLLEYLLIHPEYEVCTYINDKGFSLMHKGNQLVLKFLNLFKYMEHKSVLKKNGIDPKKVTVLKKISEIKEDDLVIVYRHHKEQLHKLNEITAFKALSFIHFTGFESEAERIEQAQVQCFYNECNLQKTSEIYNKYYHFDTPWVVHPFVYAERFQNKKSFNERKNMAFATGTITYKKNKEFLSVYGDPCDQPSRKQIKNNPEFFKDTIYCTSSDYNEDNTALPILPTDNALKALYKKFYNRTHTGQQKKYYSFDMVQSFNDYKMCIVGEEILGVPGIGFVEGMACGCAYIGIDSPMYKDLGLIPGVHYITYDGSKEDLKRVIEHYQKEENQEELEKIAKTGCEFVRTHFNGNAAAESLIGKLVKEQQNWLAEKGKQNDK